MHAVYVSPHVNFALEGLPAVLAGEGFESGVLPAVCDEVGALTECLATAATHVWLLTCKYKNTPARLACSNTRFAFI